MQCPVCDAEGYNTPSTYWKHDCPSRGQMYLTDYAELYCDGCFVKDRITKWSFNCNNGKHGFKVPNKMGLIKTISTSAQMTNSGGTQWLINILERIN